MRFLSKGQMRTSAAHVIWAVMALSILIFVSCSSDSKDGSKTDDGSTQAKSDPYNSEQKGESSPKASFDKYDMSGVTFTLDGKPMSIAGLSFTPASQWEDFGPSGMRAASYAFGPLETDTNKANLAVFHFGKGQGGTIEANMDRWINQFSMPDGRDPSTATITYEREVAGYPAHVMTLYGIFNESVTPMSQEKVAREEYRLVAIIVEAPGGNVFFKLTGPDYTAKVMIEAFITMINQAVPAG